MRLGMYIQPWTQSRNSLDWHVHYSFQELDLTPEALLLGDTSRAAPWEQMIAITLNMLDRYHLVRACSLPCELIHQTNITFIHQQLLSKQLVGMLLCIFVKEQHLQHISGLRVGAAGVGIMGMMVRLPKLFAIDS